MLSKILSMATGAASPYLAYIKWGGIALVLGYLGLLKYQLMGKEVEVIQATAAIQRWQVTDKQLRTDISILEKSAEDTRKQAVILAEQKKQSLKELMTLQEDLNNANTETNRLQKLYAKHDFGDLVQSKPGLMEKRINADLNRMFDSAKAATTP